ncbi:hypothetical protein T440DRAFT_487463 [Plenodomus tracheiphilus IPT5]|uniref:Amidohydrolase-related domain-containing protein n=1 Tax=Plenodomus tracheiphilus IPT5 TaxID=1408161 RepID=A0A6A7BGS1_9PLEO|nr:hypothetical protein T440DRAFT_487463 [Plenodomus tracheiphilus IPT5]
MAPSHILDSHIHLWPQTATTSKHHGWMSEDHFLAKRHGIRDYLGIVDVELKPWGFVYVETDRYLPSPSPNGIQDHASDAEKKKELEIWAKQPLEELRFLRRIVEEKGGSGDDGVEAGDGELMKGCVIWAPFHVPPSWFQSYLSLAESVAGPLLWRRVVGFRYLLQGKGEGEVKKLVQSPDWIENIVSLGRGRGGIGWTFDIGVDTHRDGVEPLEAVCQMIRDVRVIEKEKEKSGGSRKGVRFIFTYTSALSPLSSDTNIYIKLSGALNEFSDPTPSSPAAILSALQPYLSFFAEKFRSRIMFGSDWPVCNVGGPKGEGGGNWGVWREVVGLWVQGLGDGEGDREEEERVWWGAGCEGYAVEG